MAPRRAALAGRRTGNELYDVVAAVGVAGREVLQGRPEAAGRRRDEVGDLNNPHATAR